MQTIAAMNEFQSIIGENTGWDSEEVILKKYGIFSQKKTIRIKIMLDTNVLISALIFGGTPKQLIEQLLLMGHDIYILEYVENEFYSLSRHTRNIRRSSGQKRHSVNIFS